jgi:hypothetical protein
MATQKNKDDLTNGGFDLTNGENLPKSTHFWHFLSLSEMEKQDGFFIKKLLFRQEMKKPVSDSAIL